MLDTFKSYIVHIVRIDRYLGVHWEGRWVDLPLVGTLVSHPSISYHHPLFHHCLQTFHSSNVTGTRFVFFFFLNNQNNIQRIFQISYMTILIQVRDLPAKAEVIGWSEKTGIEMFRYGDNMLGIQGHPEFNIDIFFHFVDRLLHRNFIQVLIYIHYIIL